MSYSMAEFTEKLEEAIKATLEKPVFKEKRDFYDEHDLQFQLALKLKDEFEPAEIAFEYPVMPDDEPKKTDEFQEDDKDGKTHNRTQHIDIMTEFDDGQMVPIELKHVSKKKTDNGGFVLYDFIKDISRMEKIVEMKRFIKNKKPLETVPSQVTFGYALFVTNQKNVYEPGKRKGKPPAWEPMFLTDALYPKNYYWNAPEGSKGGRKSITIRYEHEIKWISAGDRGYYYLLIPVKRGQ